MLHPEKFPPLEIEAEVRVKGFCVYEFLSTKELLGTVQRDYLNLMAVVNLPFALISLAAGFVAFEVEQHWPLTWCLFAGYSLVFAVLLVKLFWRTQEFLHVKNVIFGSESLLIGEKIVEYSNVEALFRELTYYEQRFEEYLTRPSRLREVIATSERNLTQSTLKIVNRGLEFADLDWRIWAPAMLLLIVYAAFLYVFYYLGLLVGYFVFGCYALLLNIYLYFSGSIERRIKKAVEKIDANLNLLQAIEHVIERKLDTFSEGQISDISQFVGDKFSLFYSKIGLILKTEKHMQHVIESSQVRNFFDFVAFRNYVRARYNVPVTQMVVLLNRNLHQIEQQLLEVQQVTSDQPEFSANLMLKAAALKGMADQARVNLAQLESLRMAVPQTNGED